jgi:hypothetical protein
MSIPVASPTAPRTRTPIALPAFLGVLVIGLVLALLVNAWVGAAALALGLVVMTRPLDPFIAVLLVASVAAFAAYGDRSIQRDLAVVLALAIYAAAAFLAAWQQGLWRFPLSRLSGALVVLALTTAVATVHGLAARNTFRFLCLEVFPLASLGFALVIGGLRLRPADLRVAAWTLAAVGVASAAAGYFFYGTTGIHTGGMAFSPIPGYVALVVLSLMLHDPAPRPRFVPVLVFCVLLGHQVVTFTRGFWFGLLVGIPLICVLYARRGAGARQRWSKVASTFGASVLVLVLGALLASTRPPWSEIVTLLGNRFASSFDTRNTPETVSNLARLVEIRTTMQAVFAAPVLGYGHGATIVVRQFFHTDFAGPQWWIHQGYVMMWFKQGIVGLVALLWVLFAAFRTGIDGAFRADGPLAGWCVAAAACTVFAIIVGLTNYFFFVVSQSFLLAFVWGVALAGSKPRYARLLWRAPRGESTAQV